MYHKPRFFKETANKWEVANTKYTRSPIIDKDFWAFGLHFHSTWVGKKIKHPSMVGLSFHPSQNMLVVLNRHPYSSLCRQLLRGVKRTNLRIFLDIYELKSSLQKHLLHWNMLRWTLKYVVVLTVSSTQSLNYIWLLLELVDAWQLETVN